MLTGKDQLNLAADSVAVAGLTMQNMFAQKWRSLDPSSSTTITVLPSVEEALTHARYLKSESEPSKDSPGNETKVHAFITGSVHLVGRALGILEGIDAL